MAAGGVPRSIEGTIAYRAAHYQAICGSLTMDLSLGCMFFFIFGCCAGTETAITTLWPWKVRELAQREVEAAEQSGKRRFGMWTALRSDIQRFMQTILIGATLSGVFSTAFVTEICSQLFGGKGLAIATMSVSVLQLILCEIVPKGIAVCNAYEFASITLPWYFRISKVVYPVGRQLNSAVESFLRMFGISIDASKTPYVSEEELDLMLASAMQTGILETEEGKMISSVRELDTKRVSDIMVPLVDMICIDTTDSIAQLHEDFCQTQYSRLPVYKDRFDNVVGIVSMKTLLRKVRSLEVCEWEKLSVEDLYDRPFFVPETMTVLNLLQALKERPIAVCVDEYGGTTGLVTLEDVLEEIVGEIYDPDVEHHKARGKRRNVQIEDLGGGKYSMSASTDIDDVNAVLGVELPEGNYNSIGGFMADAADRIPQEGEVVLVRTPNISVLFEAVEVEERKVVRIVAERVSEGGGTDGTDGTDEKKSQAGDEDRLERVLEVTLKPIEDPLVEVEDGDKLARSTAVGFGDDAAIAGGAGGAALPELPLADDAGKGGGKGVGGEEGASGGAKKASPSSDEKPPWGDLGSVFGGTLLGFFLDNRLDPTLEASAQEAGQLQ